MGVKLSRILLFLLEESLITLASVHEWSNYLKIPRFDACVIITCVTHFYKPLAEPFNDDSFELEL